MNDLPALVVRPGSLTPCCDRVPIVVRARVWGCRGCGALYADAARLVTDGFGPCTDVTAMTPTRLVVRQRWRFR